MEKNSSLEENEYLSLIFQSNEEYIGMNYSIEYAFVIEEPEYSKINDYISNKDDSLANNNEENYYTQEEYIGKTAFFNITIKEDLISTCNDKCSLCYRRDINLCTICKYNYTFNEEEKICFPNPLLQTITLSSSLSAFEREKSTTLSSSSLLVSSSIKVEDLKCIKQQIIDGKCSDNISNEQIQEIYDYIKENIIKNNSKNNTIIETKNVVFQISNIEQQKDNQINISSVDLGECENIIKKKKILMIKMN